MKRIDSEVIVEVMIDTTIIAFSGGLLIGAVLSLGIFVINGVIG